MSRKTSRCKGLCRPHWNWTSRVFLTFSYIFFLSARLFFTSAVWKLFISFFIFKQCCCFQFFSLLLRLLLLVLVLLFLFSFTLCMRWHVHASWSRSISYADVNHIMKYNKLDRETCLAVRHAILKKENGHITQITFNVILITVLQVKRNRFVLCYEIRLL